MDAIRAAGGKRRSTRSAGPRHTGILHADTARRRRRHEAVDPNFSSLPVDHDGKAAWRLETVPMARLVSLKRTATPSRSPTIRFRRHGIGRRRWAGIRTTISRGDRYRSRIAPMAGGRGGRQTLCREMIDRVARSSSKISEGGRLKWGCRGLFEARAARGEESAGATSSGGTQSLDHDKDGSSRSARRGDPPRPSRSRAELPRASPPSSASAIHAHDARRRRKRGAARHAAPAWVRGCRVEGEPITAKLTRARQRRADRRLEGVAASGWFPRGRGHRDIYRSTRELTRCVPSRGNRERSPKDRDDATGRCHEGGPAAPASDRVSGRQHTRACSRAACSRLHRGSSVTGITSNPDDLRHAIREPDTTPRTHAFQKGKTGEALFFEWRSRS